MVADEKDRCGVGAFSTDAHDPFNSVCEWHDKMFVLKEEGRQGFTRKEVDRRFLKAMLIQARGKKGLVARAYLYYGLSRLFGGPFWNH